MSPSVGAQSGPLWQGQDDIVLPAISALVNPERKENMQLQRDGEKLISTITLRCIIGPVAKKINDDIANSPAFQGRIQQSHVQRIPQQQNNVFVLPTLKTVGNFKCRYILIHIECRAIYETFLVSWFFGS